MIVALNTMVKNEETMLKSVLPIWKKYDVDYYIFYDDNSTDDTVNVINSFLPEDKVIIINHNLPSFNEGSTAAIHVATPHLLLLLIHS